MSIWERLTPRTWDMVEDAYPTLGDMDRRRWYTVMYGYEYTLPVIQSIKTAPCFVGESYLAHVRVIENVEREFTGGGIVAVEEPFSGTVAVSFQGQEYPLTYHTDTGTFDGPVPGPSPESWSLESCVVPYMVIAENQRGISTRKYQVTAYKAVPTVLSVEASDCAVDGISVLRASIVITTTPSSEITLEFAGNATADFLGNTYTLAPGTDGIWSAQLRAPGKTSWHMEHHVYPGMLTASSGEDATEADFGVRVRELDPPAAAALYPTSGIFICNDCSPQFRWAVSDDGSGVSRAEVSLNDGPRQSAVIRCGEACWQMPVVPPGPHIVALYVTDNDGNGTRVDRTMTGIWLVTDRTNNNLSRLQALLKISWSAMTDAQRQEWTFGTEQDTPVISDRSNRGAYNAIDLNRVETAVDYLGKRLGEVGIRIPLEVKTDWAEEDSPTVGQMSRYLANAAAVANSRPALLKKAYDYHNAFQYPPASLPDSMRQLSADGANRIEAALTEIEKLLNWVHVFAWYVNVNARTWDELEADFQAWSDMDGLTWVQVQVREMVIEDLAAPWNVFDPRYPRGVRL